MEDTWRWTQQFVSSLSQRGDALDRMLTRTVLRQPVGIADERSQVADVQQCVNVHLISQSEISFLELSAGVCLALIGHAKCFHNCTGRMLWYISEHVRSVTRSMTKKMVMRASSAAAGMISTKFAALMTELQ